MTEHEQAVVEAQEDVAQDYDRLLPEEREALSKQAMQFFLRASVSEPTTITAQGAMIAELCQENGITSPELLGMCLLNDQSRISSLVEQAIKIHAARVDKPPVVTDLIMRTIITKDFDTADKFITFPSEDLHYIRNDLKNDQSVRNFGEAHFLQKALRVPVEGRIQRIPPPFMIDIFS